jgi:ATP-dependent Lon protease
MAMSGVTLAPELQEPLDVPDELPFLPVRDLVVFPAMIVPLFVSREVSLNAVEVALKADRFVFVSAQHDPHDDAPRVPEDVHKLGTVCLILRQRKLPDGRVKVLVQGLIKASLEEVKSADDCARVRISKIHESPFDPSADRERAMEAEALSRTVKAHLEKLIAIGKVVSPEMLLVLSGVQDPGRLADLVAANLSLKLDEAQDLLATLDPVVRLRKIHDRLAKEEQLAVMQARLQSQAKDEISKTQRDYYLREQLRQIQHELGERDGKAEMLAELGEKLKGAGLPAAAELLAQRDLKRLEGMSLDSAEGAVLRSWLETLCEIPWSKSTPDNLDLIQARKVLDDEHHGLAKVKQRILELLSVRKLRPGAKGPILLFVGPPGVGKTSLARSIARALGRTLARVSLGGVRDEAEIRGHRRTYVGALPGRIVQGLRQAATNNPVFVLDEIDKLGADVRGDPSAALLEVLDPEQNHSFRDHYLNLELDLSQVFFIATANTMDGIPPALRDRLEVIEIPGYSEEEKLFIAEKHLLPRALIESGLGEQGPTFPRAALVKLVRGYTREAGLRDLTRELASLCRKCALQLAEGKISPKEIKPGDLAKMLGVARFSNDDDDNEGLVGCATGLAWTQYGGEVLRIEVAAMRAHGRGTRGLILTGQLGAVMQESAQAALSWVRSRADAWGVATDFFEQHDLHLHVPAGAIPKDGPSAGVTMACALASLVRKRACVAQVAMTGELTLRGRVLAVGGLREKLLAAARAGVHTVCIPAQNARDLDELPKTLKRKLKIVPVRTLDELLEHALAGEAALDGQHLSIATVKRG